ncbi:MAG: type II toxin-antitoxin system Phd/YefM family antitoxin [Deltaproteobacteria bacterium]|nr:type II toxin-antitoxin system Phd/YefM family antitoxin [Deltaproteobacteria bacterium]
MKALRVSEDIVPVSEFKAQAAEWLRRLTTTGQPLVITQNGKPAGVLLSPEAYDELAERARFVAAVEDGLADSQAGRLTDQATLAAELKARYRARPRR